MMKPSDLANKIASRQQRPTVTQTVNNPEHQAQIDQAWDAIRPAPVTEN